MHPRSVLFLVVLAQAGFGQSAAEKPAFEVVDIKPSAGMNPNGGKIRILPGGRVDLANITLKRLIMGAYDVQADMIAGGPGWIDSDEFDIVAKAPAETPRDQIRMMMQPLLAERFKLVIHREDRPKPVYVLAVAKNGPKLDKSAGGPAQCGWNSLAHGMIQRDCHNMTMSQLAAAMPNWAMVHIDFPVVDMTGLAGAYDFKLEFSQPGGGDAGGGGEGKGEAAGPASDPGGTTVFDAMGQIGLTLQPRKQPVSVIVIDHIERPGAN